MYVIASFVNNATLGHGMRGSPGTLCMKHAMIKQFSMENNINSLGFADIQPNPKPTVSPTVV